MNTIYTTYYAVFSDKIDKVNAREAATAADVPGSVGTSESSTAPTGTAVSGSVQPAQAREGWKPWTCLRQRSQTR